MRELMPGLFEIRLKSGDKNPSIINIYIIPGGRDGRVLMIDAGYRTNKNKEIMIKELADAGIPFDKLDIFLTHKHHDHTGLANFYATRGARIFMNPLEDRHAYDCIYYNNNPKALEEQQNVLRTVGVTAERTPELYERFMEMNREIQEANKNPELQAESAPSDTIANAYTEIGETLPLFQEHKEYEYEPLDTNMVFEYGNYKLHTMPLRGHTYGQMGLYDVRNNIVFCADQFISGIIPIVGTSYVDEHLLGSYFQSLETFKIRFRGFMVYPSHREPYPCHGEVAAKPLNHYQDKLNIIFTYLAQSRKKHTVQELAFHAYGIKNNYGWDNMIETKMIITKTFSCLEYLYDQHMVSRENIDGTLFWEFKCEW